MRLTIAICTWNRAALLRQTLDHMTRLVVPTDVEWELLVVNNNCTDHTDDVIASFASKLPVQRLSEPKQGKSNACNLATQAASGEYILWTDDDVQVDENWIAAYCRAFRKFPSATFFGGPIHLWFGAPPPRWMERACRSPSIGAAWGARDFAPDPIPLDRSHVPYGANWAVKTIEQRQYLYEPRLGIEPTRSIHGEETHLMKSLLADGYVGWWVPHGRVRHYVPPEAMTTRWVRNAGKQEGTYLALTEPEWTGRRLFGKPRFAWKQAFIAEARYWVHRLFSKPETWVGELLKAGQAWAYLRSSGASVDRSGVHDPATLSTAPPKLPFQDSASPGGKRQPLV